MSALALLDNTPLLLMLNVPILLNDIFEFSLELFASRGRDLLVINLLEIILSFSIFAKCRTVKVFCKK